VVATTGSLFTPVTSGAAFSNVTPSHTPVSGDWVAYGVTSRRNGAGDQIPDFSLAHTFAGTWNFTRYQWVSTTGNGYVIAVFVAKVPATTQVPGTVTISANLASGLGSTRWRITGDFVRDATFVAPYNVSLNEIIGSTTPLLAIDPPGATSVVMGWVSSGAGAGSVTKGALFTEAHNVADGIATTLEVEYVNGSPPAYADWTTTATTNYAVVIEFGPARTAVTKTLDIRRRVYSNTTPPDLLDSGEPSATSTFVTTAVLQPVPGRDLDIWVITRDNGGVTLPNLGLSHSFGGGLTFTEYTTTLSGFNRFSLFRALVPVGAGKSAVTISITNGLTGVRWGWIASDAPSLGTLVQSAVSPPLTSSSPSQDLAAAPSSASYVISGVQNGGATSKATANDTEIKQVRGTATLQTSLSVQYRTGSSAVAMGWTGCNVTQNVIIGFELSQSNAVSKTLDIRRAVQNSVSKSYDIRRSILKPVSKAYDIRRAILVPVSKSYDLRRAITAQVVKPLDIRRAIQKTIFRPLDIRRAVQNVVAPRTLDIRRAIQVPVSKAYDIRRTIIAQVAKTLDIRRSILKPVSKSYDIRRSILKPVSNSYDFRRSILKIMSPASSVNIRRALLNTVSPRTLDIRRSIINTVTRTLDIRRSVLTLAARTLDIRRSVTMRAARALDIRRSLLNTVPARTLDVRRAVLALATRALDIRRGVLRIVATTLDIRRDILSIGHVTRSIDIRRSIIGRTAPSTLSIRRAVLVPVAKTVDIRRAINIEVFYRLSIKRSIINTISRTLDIRRTVTVTVPPRSLDIRRSVLILASRTLDIRRAVTGKLILSLDIRRSILVRGPVSSLQLRREIFLSVPPSQLAIFRRVWQAARSDLELRREIHVLYGQPFGLRLDHVIYDIIFPTVIDDEIGVFLNLFTDAMQPTVVKAQMGMPQNVRKLV
jgi:hypothetical protein